MISIKNITKQYGGRELFSDVSFDVLAGERVGLVGRNGHGKTTLFRLLLGLALPLKGSLSVFGKVPSRGNPRIGYIPQRHPIDEEIGIEALQMVRLGIDGDSWGIGMAKGNEDKAMAALKTVMTKPK